MDDFANAAFAELLNAIINSDERAQLEGKLMSFMQTNCTKVHT